MKMGYKSSMFNFIFQADDELILFNALEGLSSACRVDSKHRDEVRELLRPGNKVIDASLSNENIVSLIRKGYLVEEDIDEKQKREALYTDIIDGSASILRLIILPTEQCNYRCKYCYESFKKGKMPQDIQESVIKYVRKNIGRYSGLRVSWFGGEPLLAMDVIEHISINLMDICRKARRKYISDITTNGYLLSLENFKKLLSLNVIEYQITIDGTKEIHDTKKPLINGDGTFDVVTNNLRDIKQNIKTSTFSIIIRSNVTDEALLSLDDFTAFFDNLLKGDKRFSFFLRPAGDWGGNNRLSEMLQMRIEENQIGYVYQNFVKKGYPFNVYTHESFYRPGGCMCYAAFVNTYVICSDGNIRKCTCELDDDKYSIGKLLANGSIDIDKLKSGKWTGNQMRYSPKCDNCAFSPLCFGACCPKVNLFDFADGSREEPKCPSEMNNIFETLVLIDKCIRFPYLEK